MNKTITKIEAISTIPKRKRVAAYARVSSGKEEMINSLATQVGYYKRMIQSRHDYEFVGVYADKAITGTKESRDEFQLLLRDAKSGKIDMIITKSISRFARNTLTLLKTIRELKALNVDVYFEEQNIHTLSSEGEMILTFLATFAQEESRSVSENMKWRIKKDFMDGLIWGGNSCLGYRLKDKKLHIVPEEAETVRLIYNLYLEGNADEHICDILNHRAIKPYKTKKWNRSSVIKILTNYNYTGDLLLQKTYRNNHLDKKRCTNNGELNKYLVSNAHEAIISKDIFNQAQKVRKLKTKNINLNQKKSTLFRGYIKCGKCGKAYTYKKTPYNIVWMCSTLRTKGKQVCDAKQVPEAKIIEGSNNLLNMETFDLKAFKKRVEQIVVLPDNKLLFQIVDGINEVYEWEYEPRSKSWTKEMRESARLKALARNVGGNGLCQE
jgi:site-specific DNA recombinase